MEGVAGIVKWGQTAGGDTALYQEGRVLYTEEMNAAVRGAKAAGATEIVVMDCHGAGGDYTFNSLVPDLLDPDCEYVVQSEWTEYTDLLEQGCDAALFVGMHAMAGSETGVLSHTVSGQAWLNLRFNGTLVGETGINAALCGNWGCPVAPRHRRPRRLRRGARAARRRADDGRGEGRARPLQRAAEDAGAGARADRGGREASAGRSRRGQAVRPGQPVRDRDPVHLAGPARRVREPQRRRGRRMRARSSSAATTGGAPGRGSTSR